MCVIFASFWPSLSFFLTPPHLTASFAIHSPFYLIITIIILPKRNITIIFTHTYTHRWIYNKLICKYNINPFSVLMYTYVF